MKISLRYKFRKRGEWNQTIAFDGAYWAFDFIEKLIEKTFLPESKLYLEVSEID